MGLKERIKAIPFINNIYSSLQRKFMTGERRREVFDKIYNRNHWGSSESVSGPGSTLEQTSELLRILPAIFAKYEIKTINDAPCGDFNWMKLIDLTSLNYRGFDIVPEVIQSNQRRYGSSNIQFEISDIVGQVLPASDLILCRDCLVHLSFSDIFKALENFEKSASKYLLTTSFDNKFENKDIHTGNWRPLNLEIPPFKKIKVIERFDEMCAEDRGKKLILIELSKS